MRPAARAKRGLARVRQAPAADACPVPGLSAGVARSRETVRLSARRRARHRVIATAPARAEAGVVGHADLDGHRDDGGMRTRTVVLLALVGGSALLLFEMGSSFQRNRAQGDAAEPKPSYGAAQHSAGDATRAAAAPALNGLDDRRKRKIVTACFCMLESRFLPASGRCTGLGRSEQPARGISDVQQRYFQQAEKTCVSDPAARTAPVDDFLADLAWGGNMAAAACSLRGHPRTRSWPRSAGRPQVPATRARACRKRNQGGQLGGGLPGRGHACARYVIDRDGDRSL